MCIIVDANDRPRGKVYTHAANARLLAAAACAARAR